jgi:hypothetical protein
MLKFLHKNLFLKIMGVKNMQDDCLYVVKNKNYFWIKIGYIALMILFPFGIILPVINFKFIWITIISALFAIIPLVSRHRWKEIRFYYDRLEEVKLIKPFCNIYYEDIKAIQRCKKSIYIIEKDKERDLITRKRRAIRGGTYKISDRYDYNILIHKYVYNTLVNIPNEDEIYNKIIEIVKDASIYEEQHYEDIRKNFTPLYIDTYLNYKQYHDCILHDADFPIVRSRYISSI